MAIERRRVFFAGHVQGVGFRMTTRRLALGRPVAGFVRNLADGRVELLIEGEPGVLSALVESIRREFGDSIRDIQAETVTEADAPLAGFSIR